MKNKIYLTIDNLTNYFEKQNSPYKKNDFVPFKNNIDQATENKYIVSNGIIISIIRKGKIDIQLNNKKYTAGPSAIISLFPDFAFDSYIQSQDAKVDNIFISLDLIHKSLFQLDFGFIIQLIINPVLTIPDERFNYLVKLKNVLTNLYEIEDNTSNRTILKSVLYTLLNQIKGSYSKLYSVGYIDKLNNLREITSHFSDTWKDND